MINNVSTLNLNRLNSNVGITKKVKTAQSPSFGCLHLSSDSKTAKISSKNIIRTTLTPNEQKMFIEINNAIMLADEKDKSVHSEKCTQSQKLQTLLKSGKLLSTNSNNQTTTLENLYKILNTQRVGNFSSVKLLNQTIDAIFDPTIITQKFGDVPNAVKKYIYNSQDFQEASNTDINEIDVNQNGSGTCPAASLEYTMANKMPAEFARWANELTSPNMSVRQVVNSASLSKNPLEAIEIMKMFDLAPNSVTKDTYTLELIPDNNAYIRAQIQDNCYDKGERSMIDVLVQSTIMNMGSKRTYNSLNDKRAGDVEQGLQEHEKTFMESVISNKEKTTITYLKIAEDGESVLGRNCSKTKTRHQINKALKMGEDVVIGYRDTYGDQVFWHEMTITGIKKDFFGRTTYLCNDTDDNKETLIEWKAKDLIPKIHHATFPAKLVENVHNLNLLYG